MKSFFSRDSVLKLLSFVITVLIWFYIIIVVDPSVDITIRDIPIRYVNQSTLEDHELSIINDGKTTVELKIRGSRKKIANIDNKNVYATVDLANISKTGTFSLPISISIPYEYSEIISKKPYNADVIVDRVVEKETEVKVITSGNVANGYIAGEAVPSSKTVVLRGASTLVNSIGGVAVKLSYSDRTAEIKDAEKLYFIDLNGKKIEQDNDLYDDVKMNISTVEVTCPVFKLKTVPVKIEFDDNSKLANYKISVQPSNVTVYAENDILSETVEIATEQIDFKVLEQEGAVDVPLIIPKGIFMRDGIKEVTVKAEARN